MKEILHHRTLHYQSRSQIYFCQLLSLREYRGQEVNHLNKQRLFLSSVKLRQKDPIERIQSKLMQDQSAILSQVGYFIIIQMSGKESTEKIKIEPTFSQISDRKFAQVSLIGNYKYYHFYGCLLSEPCKYFGTHGLFLFGLLIYYIFCAKYQHPAIITLSVLFHILIVIVLVVLAFVDPGIIPKILPHYQNAQLHQIPIDPDYLKQSDRDNKMASYISVQKTHFLKLKFCSECCIYRPPRTTHCYQCDICVQKFDHHCPWIGTCVGKNNYKYFFLFLVLSSILLLMVIGQSINGIVEAGKLSQGVYIAFNVILCIYCFLALGFVGTLLGLHFYLAKNNMTTYEYCKDTWDVLSGNPFGKKKAYKNFFKMFDSPIIVVSDPQARLKDRERIDGQAQAFKDQDTNCKIPIKSSSDENSEKQKEKIGKNNNRQTKRGIMQQDINMVVTNNERQQ